MFDVGFAELFLLSLIGLIVLGPERLPAVARTLGGFVRKARISYHNLKRTVEAELAAAEAANPIKDAQKELESVQQRVNELKGQLDQDIAPKLIPEVDGETRESPALEKPETASEPEAKPESTEESTSGPEPASDEEDDTSRRSGDNPA